MRTGQITLEDAGAMRGPATVRICRPEVGNALNRAVAEDLSVAVDILAADPPAGVVLAAQGDRFFGAGGDLDDYRALTDRDTALEVSLRMQDILGRLRALPCLVVCAIELLATGRTVGAEEAGALSLVHTIVPAGQAETAARAVIELAGGASRDVMRAVKSVLDPGADAAEVARIFSELWVGADHRAAEAAWRERPKRPVADLPR